ncbi:MAG: hypothetical protein KFF50_07860 [Desulfatitalea sp.]|nr:hypothetical protein [Desulfatitalea sp.]
MHTPTTVHPAAVDPEVPGGVYLCQVNGQVSCGACCGLYNVADPSREGLQRQLERRTRAFGALPRTVAAMDGFARATAAGECQERPFPDFHHCPFIGLIGPDRSRVGCLLHPLGEGNAGIDLRGLSDYGGLACRTYFCPATHQLPGRHKQVLRLIFEDWHLYGMVVTEAQLVGAMFHWIERRLGYPLEPPLVTAHPQAPARLRDLLALKRQWPFRPPDHDTPCHYFFTDPPHVRPPIDYRRLGAAPSPLDVMLRELVSHFGTQTDLQRAEQLLENRLVAAAHAMTQPLKH